MSSNIEWLIGEYRSQKNKVIGLQCDYASIVRKNEALFAENNNLRTVLRALTNAASEYVADSEGESELDPFIANARTVLNDQ